MRLGTRWSFGDEPPASVPEELRPLIAAAESRATDAAGRHWTLTWLEGRPIAELDDGTIVTTGPVDTGAAPTVADDDW
jgi:nitroreductase